MTRYAAARTEEVLPAVTGSMPLPSCPACGHPHAKLLFDVAPYRYMTCSACNLAYLDPTCAPKTDIGLFEQAYFEGGAMGGYLSYESAQSIHRRNARARLASLGRTHLGPPGRLLDVGCALGTLSDEARGLGWHAQGIELSDWASTRARERLGLTVHRTLTDLLAEHPAPFDAITFIQVLEHMPDPSKALAEARRLLAPNGVLLIETWDLGSRVSRVFGRHWQQVNAPTVRFLFDRVSLRRLLETAGFRDYVIRVVPKWVSLGHAAQTAAAKLLPGADRLVKRLRGLSLSVPYFLDDLILVVARG
jgi:2-polyprenyl-3-methyl-5-hydroxy-6-metoxy-1,4-benzoquinol methylase